MKKTLALLYVFLFLAGIGLTFASSTVSAQGLGQDPGLGGIVPCGRNIGSSDEKKACTLCHLVVGIQRIFRYGLYIVIAISFLAIFLAGGMYIVSSGDDGMMTAAKSFLKSAIIGFALVAGAWVIVNTILWSIGTKFTNLSISQSSWDVIQCDSESSGTSSSGNPGIPSAPTPTPTPTPAPSPNPTPTPPPNDVDPDGSTPVDGYCGTNADGSLVPCPPTVPPVNPPNDNVPPSLNDTVGCCVSEGAMKKLSDCPGTWQAGNCK